MHPGVLQQQDPIRFPTNTDELSHFSPLYNPHPSNGGNVGETQSGPAAATWNVAQFFPNGEDSFFETGSGYTPSSHESVPTPADFTMDELFYDQMATIFSPPTEGQLQLPTRATFTPVAPAGSLDWYNGNQLHEWASYLSSWGDMSRLNPPMTS